MVTSPAAADHHHFSDTESATAKVLAKWSVRRGVCEIITRILITMLKYDDFEHLLGQPVNYMSVLFYLKNNNFIYAG